MCAWRYFGRAKADPSAPRACGYCDRCGLLYQLSSLHFQFQWRGSGLANTGFRVCYICRDKPSAFLQAIRLPADPVPVQNPRVGNTPAQMQQGQPLTWDQELNPGVPNGTPIYYQWDSPDNVWL